MSTVVRQRAASGSDLESAVEEGTVRELALAREPQMAGRARTFLRKTAVDWSLDEEAAETAELVLSELFTNALQHTAGQRLRVGVRLRGELLFVEVFDQNPRQQLTPTAPDPEAENGRGLLIVQAVSLRWGRRREAGGSVTWACLALPGHAAAQVDDADGPAQGGVADSLPQPAHVAGADYPFPSYEGDCVSHSPPAAALALNEAWEALADGLHVQRLALHREQLREMVTAAPADVTLFTQASPAALTARPDSPAAPQDLAAVTRAGLAHWVSLPAEHGTAAAQSNPLTATGHAVAEGLLTGVEDSHLAAAVRAVCAASAWWVGAFAAIRHLGVHHTTLQPVIDQISLETLHAATRTVALGTATRVLQHQLRTEAGDEPVRLAYCRAVTEGIVCESGLPALLDELGELRLVDLVGTSIPWRGRFTKYAGGTGAGQVE